MRSSCALIYFFALVIPSVSRAQEVLNYPFSNCPSTDTYSSRHLTDAPLYWPDQLKKPCSQGNGYLLEPPSFNGHRWDYKGWGSNGWMFGEEDPLKAGLGFRTIVRPSCDLVRSEILQDLQDIMASLLTGPDGQASIKNYLDNEAETEPDDVSKVVARTKYIKALIEAKSTLQQAKGEHK